MHKKDFPQIDAASRIARRNPTLIVNDNYFLENISLVDPDIINIFDFNVIQGDLGNALNDKSSLVLNESIAQKYFPNKNPIGQIITIDFNAFKRDYKVAAIIEDMPTNSQINITSMVVIDEEAWKEYDWMFDAWFSANAQLFFTLRPETNISQINDNLDDFINRNFPSISL